jgi:hypothetical protein
MKILKRLIVLGMVVLGGLIGMQTSSYAASFALLLEDGVNPAITINDGGLGDLDSRAGVIVFNGSIGVWTLNVSTGLTYPEAGSPAAPYLDLNSLNSSTGAGTLDIYLSATDYTRPGGAVLNVGGTTAGTAEFSAYYDPGNALFAETVEIGELEFVGPAFSGTAGGPVVGGTPYSLTVEATIEHGGRGVSSFDAELKVPEPSLILLMGFGLVGLWGFRKRSKK